MDYRRSDGEPCSIHVLCHQEPEWAASIIPHLKAENAALREKLEKTEEAFNRILRWIPALEHLASLTKGHHGLYDGQKKELDEDFKFCLEIKKGMQVLTLYKNADWLSGYRL